MNFLRYAFLENRWSWFHGLFGGVLALWTPLWFIFVLAVGWEVFKYVITDVEKVYGSRSRWFLDSFGDVFLAMAFAVVVKLAGGM